MAELYDDWLARPMSRAEYWTLSDEEIEERKLAQNRIYSRKWTVERPEYSKKYIENNPEKRKETSKKYSQTPAGQKSNTLSTWKNQLGLQETPEEMDRIYELRQTQEFCSSCDVKLTRDGDRSSTDASMDHSHETNRFRQICCKKCNSGDRWRIYWIDGIYGGTKVPLGRPDVNITL